MILKETILSVFNERATLLKWLKKVEALTLEIIERALLKPIDNPQSASLVAVDNTGAQVMLEVGTGLIIENGVLKIQKSNSVLGLRRFNESVTPYATITSDEMSEFYSNNVIKISDIYIENTDFTLNEFTPLVNLDGTELILVGYNGEMFDGATFEDFMYSIETYGNNTINVLSTANTTVDEWLLANTESV